MSDSYNPVNFTDCVITGNTDSGGGILALGLPISILSVAGSTISHNSTVGIGGGIGIVAGDLTLVASTVGNNTATDGPAGGTYRASSSLISPSARSSRIAHLQQAWQAVVAFTTRLPRRSS